MGYMKNLAVRRAMGQHKARINPRPDLAVPLCPYCNRVLDGPTINGLHAACNDCLSEEMADWEQRHPLFVQE